MREVRYFGFVGKPLQITLELSKAGTSTTPALNYAEQGAPDLSIDVILAVGSSVPAAVAKPVVATRSVTVAIIGRPAPGGLRDS